MTIDKYAAFRALHQPGTPLLLANAWDVASARLAEQAGSAAVATTSAGVAWSLGAADGDVLDRDRAVDLVARVAGAVAVPVTADIEGGFATDAAGVAETVRLVVAAGAAGVNLEDSDRVGPAPLLPVDEAARRIAAARAAAGAGLFINARVDTFLRGGDVADVLTRARAYVAAGADGVFVPGTADPAVIAELVAGVGAPLNILAGPGSPTVAELAALGVARVSLGSSVAEAAYAVMRRATEELLAKGTYDALAGAVSYGELNKLLA
ncbi:isocitrate lyase/PEP mutase family protein [Catellatospora paridis]|uniref:isocitrate lyase/PEP mutase family protein n=1 Tax=Catellatospora paridis TaxID=1617086 RepID=UPI0012D3B60C|nr:isocitrate lyase/phosphoenolpyruvate mutase family protein [Catellatospora paridis]